MIVPPDKKDRSRILKSKATGLRLKGLSIRSIEIELGIPKSTLSGWFKDIELTNDQKNELLNSWKAGLVFARERAALSHKKGRLERIAKIQKEAKKLVADIKFDNQTLEIFLSGLYLGEGFKREGQVGFCNSNPRIMQTFLKLLRTLYNIDETRLKAGIFGRADQNPRQLESYWSNALDIPVSRFNKTHLDQRTAKTKTFENYHGVCAIYYNDTAIQRKILAVSEEINGRLAQLVRARH